VIEAGRSVARVAAEIGVGERCRGFGCASNAKRFRPVPCPPSTRARSESTQSKHVDGPMCTVYTDNHGSSSGLDGDGTKVQKHQLRVRGVTAETLDLEALGYGVVRAERRGV
jgi:hypothetical protein